MSFAPAVSQWQAGCLRLARDLRAPMGADEYYRRTVRSCVAHGWLEPSGQGYVLTRAGRAALAHFDLSGGR